MGGVEGVGIVENSPGAIPAMADYIEGRVEGCVTSAGVSSCWVAARFDAWDVVRDSRDSECSSDNATNSEAAAVFGADAVSL